jgi:hypothetical protein
MSDLAALKHPLFPGVELRMSWTEISISGGTLEARALAEAHVYEMIAANPESWQGVRVTVEP